MIKEWLERRKLKKSLQAFRVAMEEDGVSLGHLTDDELVGLVSKWVERINEAFKPLLLSIEQAGEAMGKMAKAFEEVNSAN